MTHSAAHFVPERRSNNTRTGTLFNMPMGKANVAQMVVQEKRQGKRGSNGSARKKANHRALARYLEAVWTGVPLAAPPTISGSEQDLWIRAVKKREALTPTISGSEQDLWIRAVKKREALTELEKEEKKKNYPWHSSLEMASEGLRKVGENVSRLVEKQPDHYFQDMLTYSPGKEKDMCVDQEEENEQINKDAPEALKVNLKMHQAIPDTTKEREEQVMAKRLKNLEEQLMALAEENKKLAEKMKESEKEKNEYIEGMYSDNHILQKRIEEIKDQYKGSSELAERCLKEIENFENEIAMLKASNLDLDTKVKKGDETLMKMRVKPMEAEKYRSDLIEEMRQRNIIILKEESDFRELAQGLNEEIAALRAEKEHVTKSKEAQIQKLEKRVKKLEKEKRDLKAKLSEPSGANQEVNERPIVPSVIDRIKNKDLTKKKAEGYVYPGKDLRKALEIDDKKEDTPIQIVRTLKIKPQRRDYECGVHLLDETLTLLTGLYNNHEDWGQFLKETVTPAPSKI